MMTVSAAVRLMPRPPARVDSRKQKRWGSELKSFMARCRSCQDTEPSRRQLWKPSCSRYVSKMSSILVICRDSPHSFPRPAVSGAPVWLVHRLQGSGMGARRARCT